MSAETTVLEQRLNAAADAATDKELAGLLRWAAHVGGEQK